MANPDKPVKVRQEFAALAQSVEYLPSKQAVIGSIPIRRSNTCRATVDAVLTDIYKEQGIVAPCSTSPLASPSNGLAFFLFESTI